VPPPVAGLLDLVRWKIRARNVGIEVINQIEHEIVLRPVPTPRINQARLLRQFGREIRFTPNTIRLNARHLPDWRAALNTALTEVEAAAAHALPALTAAGAGSRGS
jgi:hypothetical protein